MKAYEPVIGLEVHVELATATKIFCSCPTDTFGAEPNTAVCPVCMGLPGALPVLNRRAVEYAALAGLALGCTIEPRSGQDRKNYFYPDLPKAYQISQYDRPLCHGGCLEIDTAAGHKRIGITRIHIEEDAGKLIHDSEQGTMIDYNRCGVPLIEIVSEPDIRSAEEAKAYLQKLRSVIRYTGVSDCHMNEGAFRCDVNLSVRPVGETALGTRTELKNLNSFAFVAKAIESEFRRQVDALERGEDIRQETRRFDPATGKTYPMRQKENAEDYRYFPDPDLPDVVLAPQRIDALRASLPPLPDARRARYMADYGLSPYDAEQLTADRAMADCFEAAARLTEYPKLLANLMISELTRLSESPEFSCPIAPEHLAELATLSGERTVNSSTAKKLLARMWERDESPRSLVKALGWEQITDPERLRPVVRRVLDENPQSVTDYRNGKKAAAKALVGKVMSATDGKADPILVHSLVDSLLFF
ncbi:MAG: Asp-tRNA(Asn)/Glu-tRNA(Gln) amidotransferase subunit GatB [Clostridia bacterium]|nr:Asp-tRNA(Asn)/Glu-tRNA(Gln) amidotransferase subunit GatB [Clostridia bacterium]